MDHQYERIHTTFGINGITDKMAFSWSSFLLPRPLSQQTEDENLPTLSCRNEHPVTDDRLERDDIRDESEVGDMDMLREMHEQLLRVWAQVSPHRWEQEVQMVSDRFRATMPEGQGARGPALDVVASRQTVGASIGAQVMLDTGNRMVETGVPFDDLARRCVGAREKKVEWEPSVTNQNVDYLSINHVSHPSAWTAAPQGTIYQGLGTTGLTVSSTMVSPVVHEQMLGTSGAPDVMSTVRQAVANDVSQIPAVSMVTRPTSTYTWQRPLMSYFSPDSQIPVRPGSPMSEENSLHGRIWLPASQSTPWESQLGNRMTEPKTAKSQAHWNPWELVSDDRATAHASVYQSRDPGHSPCGPLGQFSGPQSGCGPSPVSHGIGSTGGTGPTINNEVHSDLAYRHFFEAGIQWAMGNVTPSFRDPSGQSGTSVGAMGHTAGVPRGSAVGTPVLPVTSGADGSRTHGETQTGVHGKMPDIHVVTSQPVSTGLKIFQGTSGNPAPAVDRDNSVNVTTAGGRSPRRHQPKKVAKYDGKSSWADYLVQFDIAAHLNDWDDDQKAMELATSLEGTAWGVLADVSPQDRLNFKVLVDRLTQRFEPEGHTATYQSQLQSRKRRRNESIPELVQDICRITRKAYPTADVQTRNALAVTSFISALANDAQQLFMYQKDPRTLEEAGKAAHGFETFQAAVSKDSSYVRTQQAVKESSTPPMWAREWMSKIEKIEKRLSAEPRGPSRRGRGPSSGSSNAGSRRSGACFHCGSVEHFIRDCPLRRNQGNTQSPQITAATSAPECSQIVLDTPQSSLGNE